MQECPRCTWATHSEARFCGQCGASLEILRTVDQRKIVTVVFCGLRWHSGDQLLDIELMSGLEHEWYDTARDVLSSHGGTVRKHATGESVMAVFGVPRVHEDDALRAIRAIDQLRSRLAELSTHLQRASTSRLQLRAGVHTGEAMTRSSTPFEPFAYGDAVNVAARLEQAASVDEILISEATWRLVREEVDAGPRSPLVLRGRKVAVEIRQLRAVRPITARPGREFDVSLVGRKPERQLFELLFERAFHERAYHGLTILGPAGAGKSRLAVEIERTLAGRARVLWGRCLVYGDDITYWPMVETVSQAAEILPTDSPERIRGQLAKLVQGDERAARIAAGLAEMLGLVSDGLQEDVLWALRTLFELLSRREPLVVVIDDLHWAQDTLLDAVDYLVEWSHDAPVVLVCLARPELLERRRTWGGGRAHAASVMLGPLTRHESQVLMVRRPGGAQLDPELKAEVIATAEGNPLFIEELVAMLSAQEHQPRPEPTTESQPRMPPNIQALLTARLDQLNGAEQIILERAAVIGKRFQESAVTELCAPPLRPHIPAHLQALVRMDLIRPDTGGVLIPMAEDNSYQFRHGLIRDAAYHRMAKEARLNLHERYASWLELVGRKSPIQSEFAARHLELAYRYSVELGSAEQEREALALRAAYKLVTAGQRAIARGDIPATQSLLTRAVTLLPEREPVKIDVLLDLAVSLQRAGELESARATYDEAASLANASNREFDALRVQLRRSNLLWYTDPVGFLTESRRVAERAVKELKGSDELYLGVAWRILAGVSATRGRSSAARAAIDNAIKAARRAGNESLEAQSLINRCFILHSSATASVDVEKSLDETLSWAVASGARRLEAAVFSVKARVAATQRRFDEARSLLTSSRVIMEELGEVLMEAGHSVSIGLVELLADEQEVAERELRAGCDSLAAMGATVPLSAAMALLARVLLGQGRLHEAARITKECRRIATRDNHAVRTNTYGIRAVLLAWAGKADAAERLARKVVALAECREEPDPEPEPLAQALGDLAVVLRMARRIGEADDACRRARDIYATKGNVVAAETMEQLLTTH